MIYLFVIVGLSVVLCVKKCCRQRRERAAARELASDQPQRQMSPKGDNVSASSEAKSEDNSPPKPTTNNMVNEDETGTHNESERPSMYPSSVFTPPIPRWSSLKREGKFGKSQCRLLILYYAVLVFAFVLMLILGYTWEIDHYTVYDRRSQEMVTEDIPPLTAKVVQIMYAWNGLATNVKLHLYAKWFTQWCGTKYKTELSNAEKDVEIKQKFIDEYAIDMMEYNPSQYRLYSSVNTWFIRGLADGSRPLAGKRLAFGLRSGNLPSKTHQNILVSPADCRILIFPTLKKSRVWVKGSRFNYEELLGGSDSHWRHHFTGGSMVIARLAPQDYHRFNTPVAGEIVAYYELDGTYWSVNADAAKSQNYAFYNLRKVMIIKYTDAVGQTQYMAYVAIGATCVGSVIFTKQHGMLTQGEELGFMQFGGSTIIMLFSYVCQKIPPCSSFGNPRHKKNMRTQFLKNAVKSVQNGGFCKRKTK